jgi:hypothetical protein
MNAGKIRNFSLLLCTAALFMAILACTINVGGPDYPDRRIPVSTDAVAQLQSAIQTSIAASAGSGQVTLIISESQLTSYMANSLLAQEKPIFTDPQVYLQDGQIQIYGTAHKGDLLATIEIAVTAGVDSQGQLKIELSAADFGPLPVPEGLKDALTAMIQEAYTGSIGPAAVGIRLESIQITNGMLTIVGRTK